MLGEKLFILLYLICVAAAQYPDTSMRRIRRIPIQPPSHRNIIEINAVPPSLASLAKKMSELSISGSENLSASNSSTKSDPELNTGDKQDIPTFGARSSFLDPELELQPELEEPKTDSEFPNLSTTLKPEQVIPCKAKNAYYPIPDVCDTFIECQQYISKKKVCPDGLLFNPQAKWPRFPCSYPWEVECGNNTITETAAGGECPRRFGTFASNENDCGKYIVCDDGRPVHMNCPMGLAFNSKIGGCDWPDNVPDCNPDVFKDFICPVVSTDLYGKLSDKVYKYRYKSSCKDYVACIKGKPRLLHCDSGLSFDEITASCITSDAVVNCKIASKIVDTKLYVARRRG